jgi:hypothetical protein
MEVKMSKSKFFLLVIKSHAINCSGITPRALDLGIERSRVAKLTFHLFETGQSEWHPVNADAATDKV